MIKNIIFDVGKVLVEVRWLEVMQELGLKGETLERVSNATVNSSTWAEYDRNLLSYDEMLRKFIANDSEMENEIRLFMKHEKEAIRQFPYAKDWVKSFKERGYRCYVLSNYPERTFEITKEERPYEQYMDGMIYSCQVQMIKPERAIYETLLKRYKLLPEECVFLDDNPANVEAARRLGIFAIQFTTKEDAQRELEKLGV